MKTITTKQLGLKLSNIINVPGEFQTDGQTIDRITELLEEYGL